MTEPTDAELDELRQANSGKLNFVTFSEFRTIARAVLAKWGTPPAVAGSLWRGWGRTTKPICTNRKPQSKPMLCPSTPPRSPPRRSFDCFHLPKKSMMACAWSCVCFEIDANPNQAIRTQVADRGRKCEFLFQLAHESDAPF